MRFMMFIYPDPAAEAGAMPTQEDIASMMSYNEALAQAGVLVALDGLHPSSKGARMRLREGKPIITDGPFTESKEVIGGYWILQVASREEAIAWLQKIPVGPKDMVELRQIFEMSEFDIPPDSPINEQVARVEGGLLKQ